MPAFEFKPPQSIDKYNESSIFLAGTIEQGDSVDWQAEAVDYFKEYDVNLFNPRRENWNKDLQQSMTSEVFTKQVVWEQKRLEESEFVLFNFLPGKLSPITLNELGKVAQSTKTVVVCCPKEFWRIGNVQVVCVLNQIPLYERFEDALAHIRILLQYKSA